jgi:hypothetical protein
MLFSGESQSGLHFGKIPSRHSMVFLLMVMGIANPVCE